MICPHCGQHVSKAPSQLELVAGNMRLPMQQRRLLLALMDRYGRWVSKEDLVGTVWGSRHEPENAYRTIETYVHHLRVALKPHGWLIDGMRHSGYRLVEEQVATA